MTEARTQEARRGARDGGSVVRRSRESPIVPSESISGRALVAVIAIMTFLAALTLGAVSLVRVAASDWQSSIAREVTIQIRPVQGRDVEADVRRAADIARNVPGVVGVRAYTREESARLLEPWLGSGVTLTELPVPRIVVVRLAEGTRPDITLLRRALAAGVPPATLDDHRAWSSRLAAMARTVVIGGLIMLVLVLAATGLSVVYATRGAMASNRAVVEVLHFVGARNGFIAREFERHFLWLGLKGGAVGGACAMLVFLAAGTLADRLRATPEGDQLEALFGGFALGAAGYAGIAGLVVLVAVLTAATSRWTVHRTLRNVE